MNDDNLKNLVNELNKVYDDNKDVIEQALGELNQPAGDMSIREAIKSDDPLTNIYQEIWGINKEQKAFIMSYEAILTINSGGISMLWDHYEFEEVIKLENFMEEIGAKKVCSAISHAKRFIVEQIGDKPDEDELFDLIFSDEFENLCKQYILQTDLIIEEIEKQLLKYANDNINFLDLSPSS